MVFKMPKSWFGVKIVVLKFVVVQHSCKLQIFAWFKWRERFFFIWIRSSIFLRFFSLSTYWTNLNYISGSLLQRGHFACLSFFLFWLFVWNKHLWVRSKYWYMTQHMCKTHNCLGMEPRADGYSQAKESWDSAGDIEGNLHEKRRSACNYLLCFSEPAGIYCRMLIRCNGHLGRRTFLTRTHFLGSASVDVIAPVKLLVPRVIAS